MREADYNSTSQTALAEEAAELLFDTDKAGAVASYEPRDIDEAGAAVGRLGQLFDNLPGTISRALAAASGSGNLLSTDRLQGISEIVQNADDAGASQVRILLRPGDLLVSHNGKPVRLHHVLGFATPWLSTKGEDTDTIGRFGIGLMTLRALSTTIEVHCAPYHVRLGDPTVSQIDKPPLPPGFGEAGWTTLRIPLAEGTVSSTDIEEWLARWDDGALLFLRHVAQVVLLSAECEAIRELALSRSDYAEVPVEETMFSGSVARHHAEASDGRSWLVYSVDAPAPPGKSRARKKTDSMTPISVALPLQPVQQGGVYAGLPVSPTRLSLFVSAHFDPLTSRLGFADTEWNQALVPIVAEFWLHVALDLFRLDPQVAWHSMPTWKAIEEDSGSSLVDMLEEAVCDQASLEVASRLSFNVPAQGMVLLSELAVEAQPIEGILSEAEIAQLADLPATLPSEIRDRYGRWRIVLDDWASVGADLPEQVSVEQALELLEDENRPIDSTIALTAVALKEDLGEHLLDLPCVIASDGRRLVPPSGDSPEAIAVVVTPLADQLGVVTQLHDAHLSDGEAARAVVEWLEECGALIDGSDDRAVVYRLAAAGRSGRQLEEPLTDEQVQALRDAFELMDPTERRELGTDVGQAIFLDAYTYDGSDRRPVSERPSDAYFPRAIDRERNSFAAAAEQTPGLRWLSDEYVDILRSPRGRRGLGPQRFLGLLGASLAPRPRRHPELRHRFSDPRWGLRQNVWPPLQERFRAMSELNATYTLQDYDSPDLLAVAEDISTESEDRGRRRRAGALLATLSRAWERNLSEFAHVESAYDDYVWHLRGQIRAFWLWQVSDVNWLDDESGTPRRPMDLQIRTTGNVAIHGDDPTNYLHGDLDLPVLREVLDDIGVSVGPNRASLVERLERLRDSSDAGGLTVVDIKPEVAGIYRALADDLAATTSRSDLPPTQLRSEFQRGPGLVLADRGWLPPSRVFGGPPIFGDYGDFALPVAGVEPLWRALDLNEPSPGDCLKVIHKIARKRSRPDPEDETVLLETLRALASHYDRGNTLEARRLARLALWTSKGWVRERPVYATNDPALAKGLRDQLPVWDPGGDLDQFRALLHPLRVEEIQTANAEVIDPALAYEDVEETDLFRSALNLLAEDLARNDSQLTREMRVTWDDLQDFQVCVHPSLALRVPVLPTGRRKSYKAEVDAKLDISRGRLFVRDVFTLPRVDGGGRALSSVFSGSPRRLAQAWRAAWDRVEDGLQARHIELAHQRSDRERAIMESEVDTATDSFRTMTETRRARSKRSTQRSGTARGHGAPAQRAAELGPPRRLVDPNSLTILDHRGRIEKGSQSASPRTTRGESLAQPSRVSRSPRNRSPIRGYSDLDRETVGKVLAQMVLGSDDDDIVDLRAQRGVGADLMDGAGKYYELKVSAGPEPDKVTLTDAEVQRALSTPDFFLIVVSDVEEGGAMPKLRVLVNPLEQLKVADSGSITLSGVRSAGSLVYDFAHYDETRKNSLMDSE